MCQRSQSALRTRSDHGLRRAHPRRSPATVAAYPATFRLLLGFIDRK